MVPDRLLISQMQLVSDVREWCQRKARLWQQVPWLALQADGRSGWSDSYSRAYSWGLWTLPVMKHSYYVAFVDCENGRLIRDPKKLDVLDDLTVLQIPLEALDAEAVVDGLRQAGSKPKFEPDAVRNDTTRQKLIETTGLAANRPYRRHRPIVVVEEWR